MNSHIIYHGPSLIDGNEIICIATDASKNAKTGSMLQTWIIRADIAPSAAVKTGADASICGDCLHRPANNGSCYVKVFQAPRAVYGAFNRNRYQSATSHAARASVGNGRIVRCGSYGDPAAVPAHVWQSLLSNAIGYTGYTHQWNHADPIVRANCEALQPYIMASADNDNDVDAAQALGWRTFRAKYDNAPMLKSERNCPASAEAGHKTTCEKCLACSGTSGRGHSSIVINLHGAVARAQMKRAA